MSRITHWLRLRTSFTEQSSPEWRSVLASDPHNVFWLSLQPVFGSPGDRAVSFPTDRPGIGHSGQQFRAELWRLCLRHNLCIDLNAIIIIIICITRVNTRVEFKRLLVLSVNPTADCPEDRWMWYQRRIVRWMSHHEGMTADHRRGRRQTCAPVITI